MIKLRMKKNKIKKLPFLLLMPILGFLLLQCRPTEATAENNEAIVMKTQPEPIGNLLIAKAKKHLGKPYLSHTLDKTLEEKLVVRFDGFDCTTLVENVIAEVLAPSDVNAHVLKTRYRNGQLTDYASRIHYFTEWIYENQKNGLVTDVTPSISCSKSYSYIANFMSKNRLKYNQLKSDDAQWAKIKSMEERINHYKWSYIPKADIERCNKDIEHGDILVITTNISGLETSHLGLAYRSGAEIHLLHASSDEKKVVITTKTLGQYLLANPKQTGIMVVRLTS